MRLEIDWTRCDGHGLCAQLLHERIELDDHGFPLIPDREVPDDERAVEMYDALRTFADFDGFSELKRSDRPPLDLPLFHAA